MAQGNKSAGRGSNVGHEGRGAARGQGGCGGRGAGYAPKPK